MASFNKVILLGNLTRDPQVRYIPSGMAVAEIGLAVNRTWFDKQSNSRKEETTFVDVTLWGRQAEVAGEYLAKGRQVLIEGRLHLDQWDDKETGQKRSKLKVVGESMTMVGGRNEGGGGGGGSTGGSGAGRSSGGYRAPDSSAGDSSGSEAPSYDSAPDSFDSSGGGDPPQDEVPF
ncbi:MAG: single-stranded DNA-binding protein [Planctomycetaceae bacterium]